eukprot:768715-Hanusia_phi.AAC.3
MRGKNVSRARSPQRKDFRSLQSYFQTEARVTLQGANTNLQLVMQKNVSKLPPTGQEHISGCREMRGGKEREDMNKPMRGWEEREEGRVGGQTKEKEARKERKVK